MKKQNTTHSITLTTILILGLLASFGLASAGGSDTSSDSRAIAEFEVVDEPQETSLNDNRPGLLDEQRAGRAARRYAQQLECLKRRIAQAVAAGQTTIVWSMDNLPPACQRFTGAE